jgi:hypothetical protein
VNTVDQHAAVEGGQVIELSAADAILMSWPQAAATMMDKYDRTLALLAQSWRGIASRGPGQTRLTWLGSAATPSSGALNIRQDGTT